MKKGLEARGTGDPSTLLAGLVATGLLAACTVGTGGATTGSTGSGTEGGGLFVLTPGASGGPGGAVIAELEVLAPQTQSLVLRGTIPVPKGTYPRPDGKEPFSIRDIDGNTVPTQVELVTWYPDSNDGADVVEVIGRVSVPPGTVPNTRLIYEVVENPHPKGKLPAKGHVVQLLTKRDNVMLKATDVFGHEYSIDVFDEVREAAGGNSNEGTVLRQGQGAVTIRNYGVMMPNTTNLGAPNGALKHLFGVHAYTTAWAWTDSVSLDLRINNSASGLDKSTPQDDPLSKAYFKSLELWVPQGWAVVPDIEDPFFGGPRNEGKWTAFELVAPLAGGRMHVMPSQASFHRRLALTKVGNEAQASAIVNEKWLGFAKRGPSPSSGELYSWWNHNTTSYFPQKHRLAELDYLGHATINGKLNGWEFNTRKILETGKGTGYFPFEENVMGWAHPWGVRYGGMTGGSEIFLYDGFLVAEAASQRGYKHMQNTHRMYVTRQPDKFYDKNGEPTCVDDWVINGSQGKYVPMQYYQSLLPGSPDPFGMSKSPGYQRNYVAANNLQPGYEANLHTYLPIDYQHYVRYTRAPKTLLWLGNDQLAKDDLKAAAEIFRLAYHPYAISAAGGIMGSSLRSHQKFVAGKPGIGITFGRGQGWGVDSALAAYASGTLAYRARTKPWLDQVTDVVVAGQSTCNGIIQSNVNKKLLGGQFRGRQSIEQSITEHMLYGMIETVHRDADVGRAAALDYVLGKSTESMIGPMLWSKGGKGPHSHAAVAPLQGNLPPYCGGLPPGGSGNGIDKWQIWSSFAYGLEKTGNNEFLVKAGEAAGGTGPLWSRLMNMGFNNIENSMALVADVQ